VNASAPSESAPSYLLCPRRLLGLGDEDGDGSEDDGESTEQRGDDRLRVKARDAVAGLMGGRFGISGHWKGEAHVSTIGTWPRSLGVLSIHLLMLRCYGRLAAGVLAVIDLTFLTFHYPDS
jgi:hypothetical protein